MKRYAYTILFIILLFLVCEIIANMIALSFILPTPTQIMIKLWDLRETLFLHHLLATFKIIIVCLSISVIVAILLAVGMNLSKKLEDILYPILLTSQTIPIIILAPIFVLWFGYSLWSKVLVTIVITFFPLTVTTFDGFRTTNSELKSLLRTMGATKRDIFIKLEIPSALPYFFSGLKVAIPMSVVGAAIGEWLGADEGLGYFSRRMMSQFDGAGVFAPVVVLSVLGILMFGIVVLIEKHLFKWREDK